MNIRQFISLTALLIGTSTCFQTHADTRQDSDSGGALFRMVGSNTIGAQLAPALVKSYLSSQGVTDLHIEALAPSNTVNVVGTNAKGQRVLVYIQSQGSSTGFKALLKGGADIANASRAIKDKEHAALLSRGDLRTAAHEHIIGIDGLAIIVHPSNPITKLPIEVLTRVFSGEVSNWSELGGANQPIHLYARDNRSGTWDTFKSLVLGKKAKLHPKAKRFESNQDLSEAVADDELGIGFVALPSVGRSKALAIRSGQSQPLMPSKMSIATEGYALSRRLYMYAAPGLKNPHAKAFLAFVRQYAGQKVVGEIGFVDQNIHRTASHRTPDLPSQYLKLTENAQRLNVDFRFQQGRASLDNKAKADIQRLVEYAKEHADQELILIGFGDVKTRPGRAKLLSKLRAMAVRRELTRAGVYTRNIVGYGDELPVAKNEGKSRWRNRRVEVWMKPRSLSDADATPKEGIAQR